MVRVGIVGLGFMGRMHYSVLSKMPDVEVVAVADGNARRAAGDLSGGWGNVAMDETSQLPMDRIRGFQDWRQLLGMAEVDVVDICLPTPVHAEVVVAALATGKHVLCEKPVARTSAQATAIADAASMANGLFMPAMCMRFWSEWEVLKRLVADQTYGKVRSASFTRVGCAPAGWFRDGSLSGGALLDLHVHDTDFVYHVFGKPEGVFSRGYTKATGEIDHIVTQYLYGQDGPMVWAEGSWGSTDGYGFTMRFMVNFETATLDFDFARKPDTLRLAHEGKSTAVEHPGHTGYLGELQYFFDCVRHHRAPQRVTAEDAVAGLRIVEAEKQSVLSGQIVKL